MSGWIKIDATDINSDILTGEYIFKYGDKYSVGNGHIEDNPHSTIERRCNIFKAYLDVNETAYVFYRKAEPKQPTHTEIMTKWWKGETSLKGIRQEVWFKVRLYFPERANSYCAIAIGTDNESIIPVFNDKSWFIGKESADIPPEENS